MLVDSHAHLELIDDVKNSLIRAKNENVGQVITIGTSLGSSKKAIEIAHRYTSRDLQVYATCGLHPRDGKEEVEKFGLIHCFNTLMQIAQSSKLVVGIGEAGLDYRLTADNEQLTTDEEKVFQRELFLEHIKLAKKLKLPLVIHCRNGWNEIFDLLSTVNRQQITNRGVFHSFTGNWTAAKKALDLGFYISFSGIVTFNNAKKIQDVAKKTPLERIIIETDSPFLSPEPIRSMRGSTSLKLRGLNKINEPQNVKIVAKFIADLRRLPFKKIAEVTFNNSQKLFGLE